MAERKIRVEATQQGYYGGQMREPGDEFTVEKARWVSRRWMMPLDHTWEEIDQMVAEDEGLPADDLEASGDDDDDDSVA